MADRDPVAVKPETIVHRIGGGSIANLQLKPLEQRLTPPGISVLLGGSPAESAEQMRQAFPDPHKFARIHQLAQTVGSTTAAAINQAGFVVILYPSEKFPNHARITHPEGVAGFPDANLAQLSRVFRDTVTPGT